MNKDGGNTEPSIDDIVASIRRIISDEETKGRKPPPAASAPKNEDILELTEMLNDDGSVTPLPQSMQRPAPPMVPFSDVDDEAPIYAAKPVEPIRPVEPPPPKLDVKPVPAPPPPMAIPASRPIDPTPMPQPPISPPHMAINMSTNNPIGNSGVTLTTVSPPAAPQSPAGTLASPQTAGAAASAFDRLTQAALQQNPPPAPAKPSPIPGAGKSIEDLAREMLRPMLQQWIDANLPNMVERLVQQEIQRLTKR